MEKKPTTLANVAIKEEDEDENADHEGTTEVQDPNNPLFQHLGGDEVIDLRDSTIGPSSDNIRFTTIDSGKFSEPINTQQPQKDKNEPAIPMTTHKLKILLVGNFGSGKTSIINRFVDNKFSDNSLQTFSQSNSETINQKTKTLNIDSTTIAILSITDTAGEERHAKLTKNYFTDIHGALIVFDLNDQESFAQVEKWNDELIKNAPKDLVTMLVGNKSDITERKVKVQEVNNIAQKLSFESYEVSAKTGNNVALVFEKLTNKIIARIKEPGEKVMRKDGRESLGLKDINPDKLNINIKKKCCD